MCPTLLGCTPYCFAGTGPANIAENSTRFQKSEGSLVIFVSTSTQTDFDYVMAQSYGAGDILNDLFWRCFYILQVVHNLPQVYIYV